MSASPHRPRTALVVITVVAGGCAWDTPQSTLVARSDFAQAIHDVYRTIAWAAAGIALVVFGVLVWVLVRDVSGEPEVRAARR